MDGDLQVSEDAAEATAGTDVDLDSERGRDVNVAGSEAVSLLAQARTDGRGGGHNGAGGERSRDEANDVGEEHRVG